MSYPSDLSDDEWGLIEHRFRPEDRRGHASKHPRKRIVDALLYLVEGGHQMADAAQGIPALADRR